jgi:hypothetical protein
MENKICDVNLEGVKIQDTQKKMENSEQATVQPFI